MSNIFRAVGEPIEFIAAEANGETTLKKFNMLAYTGAAIDVGFGMRVVVDLEGMTVRNQAIPILRGHDSSQIAGHSTGIDKTAKNLRVTGVLSGSPGVVDEIRATAANGFPWQASIGASIDKQMEFIDKGESAEVNGRTFRGPLYIARKTTLAEVSFVPIGADGNTSASVAASFFPTKGKAMDFEAWLKAKGIDPAALQDAARTVLEAAHKQEIAAAAATVKPGEGSASAATAPAQPEPDPVNTYRNRMSVEASRIADITAICASNPALEITENGKTHALQAHAIREGWDAEKTKLRFELETLKKEKSAAPVVIARSSDEDLSKESLTASLLLHHNFNPSGKWLQSHSAVAMELPEWLRAGINDDKKQQMLERAHRISGMSLLDVCAEAIRLDGKRVPRNRNEMIRAAFSGGTLTNIFTTNVNTMVLQGYAEAGDTTLDWTKTVDVADFKTNERPRLTKGPALDKLPVSSEAKHATRSDAGESYKIARYAQQFVIDEQDIINDTFNALADMPLEMGRAAMRVRPDLVYAIILANPTLTTTGRALFNTTDTNLGSSSALSAANLKAAISAMRLLQENSVNLGLRATHLIVPATLEWTSLELMNSSLIVIAGTAGSVTERGAANTLQNRLTVVSEDRIENGLIDPDTKTSYAGSATTWYLASTMANTIEVAYLRGTGRAPQVRSWKLEEGKWGISYDICLDIGAKAMDWRGLRKTTA